MCGPSNLQMPLIGATVLNAVILVLDGILFLYNTIKEEGSQRVLFILIVFQMCLTAVQQFLIMYVAFRDPGIINPKTCV